MVEFAWLDCGGLVCGPSLGQTFELRPVVEAFLHGILVSRQGIDLTFHPFVAFIFGRVLTCGAMLSEKFNPK